MMARTVKEIRIGEKASLTRTITETDHLVYLGLSGDFNPIHTSEEYAKQTMFGERITYGALSVALAYGIFGTKLPGPGTLAKELTARFLYPVYIGDTITAKAQVIETDVEKNTVTLQFTCENQHGKKVVEGLGVMMPPPEKLKSYLG